MFYLNEDGTHDDGKGGGDEYPSRGDDGLVYQLDEREADGPPQPAVGHDELLLHHKKYIKTDEIAEEKNKHLGYIVNKEV